MDTEDTPATSVNPAAPVHPVIPADPVTPVEEDRSADASPRPPSEARPADAARRALRAARERAVEASDADAATERSTGRPARPADAARAALRRAVSAARDTDTLPDTDTDAGRDSDSDSDTDSDTDAGRDSDSDSGRDTDPDSVSGTDIDSGTGPKTPEETAATLPENPGEDDAANAGAPAGGGVTGPRGTRPADVAREALRAARAEARQARTDTGAPRADTAAPRKEAAPPAARSESRPAGSERAAPRRRGDALGRTPGARARELRELLADAFRMPSDAPEPPDAGFPEPGFPDPGRPSGTRPSVTHPPDTQPMASAPASTPASAAAGPSAARPTRPTAVGPPATPHVPTSMASPRRDSDLRRTFPAFPPLACEDDGRFAESWWGNAWVAALEEGALDAKRLARGRGYAEQGYVDAITVTPGLVLAYVQGSRPRPYRVQVRLRTLDDADWERFLDVAADRPGHIAALLDGEMPQSLADCGVRLLPGPGDLDPQCSCPDRGHPCKHAAALCYQTARLLDADPFVLLLLRGRGEREVIDALSRLSAARAARAAQEKEPEPLPGVRATDALADRRLPPLPLPSPVPPHPEQPPVYPSAPGGPDPFALDQLATDAAARAHALLSTGRDEAGELTLWQDAVRLAAARPGSGLTAGTRALYASLASAAGRTPAELARAVAAWRQGGIDGLAVLEEPWDPPAGRFDRARPLLLAADLPAFRPARNRLTHPRGQVQLRLGRDGLWYAYESEPGDDDWWPRGTPDLDPVGALTGLGGTGDF
ncbi:SWIM zinc finger family protein [Streptomyces sp. NPDC059582]|uniref:SWIM zinc finger family protein n=1 Tax=Streptomyces sp. NPDC059582 TaxID=3346875 RepID=UPI00367E0F48